MQCCVHVVHLSRSLSWHCARYHSTAPRLSIQSTGTPNEQNGHRRLRPQRHLTGIDATQCIAACCAMPDRANTRSHGSIESSKARVERAAVDVDKTSRPRVHFVAQHRTRRKVAAVHELPPAPAAMKVNTDPGRSRKCNSLIDRLIACRPRMLTARSSLVQSCKSIVLSADQGGSEQHDQARAKQRRKRVSSTFKASYRVLGVVLATRTSTP